MRRFDDLRDMAKKGLYSSKNNRNEKFYGKKIGHVIYGPDRKLKGDMT